MLTGTGRKKGSECLPGSRGDGRHSHRRGPTRNVKAWKGHMFRDGHTAGRSRVRIQLRTSSGGVQWCPTAVLLKLLMCMRFK